MVKNFSRLQRYGAADLNFEQGQEKCSARDPDEIDIYYISWKSVQHVEWFYTSKIFSVNSFEFEFTLLCRSNYELFAKS